MGILNDPIKQTQARVKIGFDVDVGVSVYVKGNPLHKSDYVLHYAIKGTMTVEEYARI